MQGNDRSAMLHQLADNYVKNGLGKGVFENIPYHDDIELRAPIHPEGSGFAMRGKEFIKTNWWAPLPDLVTGTELIDTYVNRDKTAVTAEFLCHIASPQCTLRIVDRFEVDKDGLIISQENFFDPRDITTPGWRN